MQRLSDAKKHWAADPWTSNVAKQDMAHDTMNEDEADHSRKFQSLDRTKTLPDIRLPDELWVTMLESPCAFSPEIFHGVMLNLIKNPNITSSHLFRADILYDSDESTHQQHGIERLVEDSETESQPRQVSIPGFTLTRTIVRKLIPRNPQLDRPLIQTCHFYQCLEGDDEVNIVLYVPHIDQESDMPFYHPSVAKLAFRHTWQNNNASSPSEPTTPGTISISYAPFPFTTPTPKLSRTALKLLQTVHKHGTGQLTGYEKRVHHDQIIPQKRYQDTYTRLKTKYGRQLSEQWVEVTDPGKHVFEDIGIAAFLIELWRDMYRLPHGEDKNEGVESSKPPFPSFVDIGCGNGVLVHILIEEGYTGWGFDARERKTWSIFPPHVQNRLQQRLLVPGISQSTSSSANDDELWHSGIFAPPGTFIISNHADELTPWTPLLAHLNNSSFVAIPCCSHSLSGARFRAPATTKAGKHASAPRLPQQESSTSVTGTQAAETGSLKRTEAQKKMPSAYATLCSYVAALAREAGFEPEREVLRIPSTRNSCIIGRWREGGARSIEERRRQVSAIVEAELGRSVEAIGQEWVERASKLAKKPGSGH